MVFSLLIHGLILLGLIPLFFKADQRPIKEVTYWVVDLVNLKNDEIQRPQEKAQNSRDTKAWMSPSNPDTEAQVGRGEKVSPDEILLAQPEKAQSVSANLDADVHPETAPAPVLDELPEKTTDPMDKQVQGAPYRFLMKINLPINAAGIKLFFKNANENMLRLVNDSLAGEILNTLQDKEASVTIFFNEGGGIQKVSITPDSDDDLAFILKDNISWNSVTPPAKFGLPNKGIKFTIHVTGQGKVLVNTTLL